MSQWCKWDKTGISPVRISYSHALLEGPALRAE